jgi:hypothetical protein
MKQVQAARFAFQERILLPERETLATIRSLLEKIGEPANSALATLDHLTAALHPVP